MVSNSYAHVTSVTIPDTVTSIGSSAFAYCYDLKTINWGANVQIIGANAFSYCWKLTELKLPAG